MASLLWQECISVSRALADLLRSRSEHASSCGASRAGLTPSPTCPSLGKVAPRKRDVAAPATKRGRHSSALPRCGPMEGFQCAMIKPEDGRRSLRAAAIFFRRLTALTTSAVVLACDAERAEVAPRDPGGLQRERR